MKIIIDYLGAYEWKWSRNHTNEVQHTQQPEATYYSLCGPELNATAASQETTKAQKTNWFCYQPFSKRAHWPADVTSLQRARLWPQTPAPINNNYSKIYERSIYPSPQNYVSILLTTKRTMIPATNGVNFSRKARGTLHIIEVLHWKPISLQLTRKFNKCQLDPSVKHGGYLSGGERKALAELRNTKDL